MCNLKELEQLAKDAVPALYIKVFNREKIIKLVNIAKEAELYLVLDEIDAADETPLKNALKDLQK